MLCKQLFTVALYLLLFTGCMPENSENNKSHSALNSAEWMLGQWTTGMDSLEILENWERLGDSAYAGSSYGIENGDTVFSEKIQLLIENDTLYYIPTVRDQNSSRPVYFRLASFSPKNLTFINEMHDFPQKISYTKLNNDSIIAKISGNQKGTYSESEFRYFKVK